MGRCLPRPFVEGQRHDTRGRAPAANNHLEFGPRRCCLDRQVRQADRVSSVKAEGLRHGAAALVEDVRKLLERDYLAAGTALPMLEDHDVAKRIAAGWPADDPLRPCI